MIISSKFRATLSLVLACLFIIVLLAGCGEDPSETISKIEKISEYDRSQRDWLKLSEAYWKLENFELARDSAYSGVSELSYNDEKHDKLTSFLTEHMLPAPVANIEAGEYDKPLSITFPASKYEHGNLYILVDRELDTSTTQESAQTSSDALSLGDLDATRWDDEYYEEEKYKNVKLVRLPTEEETTIELYEPGEHIVRALIVGSPNDVPELHSEILEEKYTLTGADFQNLAFSHEPGEYKAVFSLSVNGAENSEIYYTVDGTDPLTFNYQGPELSYKGIKAEDGKITINTGITKIKARALSKNGLISPLLEGVFTVKTVFDSASNQVDEDGTYEYVCDNWSGLLRYEPNTGKNDLKFTTLYDRKVKNVISFTVTGKPQSSELVHPEALLREYTKTYIYALRNDGQVVRAYLQDGEMSGWEFTTNNEAIDRVGPGWMVLTSKSSDPREKKTFKHAFWNSTKDVVGTEEMAEKVTLMLDTIALRTSYNTQNGHCVIASNPDGSNERILWSDKEKPIVLDAMTDSIVLYHTTNNKHMVYDMKTGEHRENKVTPPGTLLGYTSKGVFITDGSIKRVAIDYSKL